MIAIFSDLHLRFHERDSVSLFEDLLRRLGENHPGSGHELWLMGDIFDVLIGPFPEWVDRSPDVFRALESLVKKNWRVLWIQGNHDFYVEELLKPMGIEVSDSEVIRTVAGKKVYLAHGDLVNQNDHKYLKWRAWTRSKSFQRAVRWLHKSSGIRAIETIALQMSRRSRKRGPGPLRNAEIQLIYQKFAAEKKKEGFDLVVLGHSHIEENLDEPHISYLNLGSWINYSPRYATWDPSIESFPKLLLS